MGGVNRPKGGGTAGLEPGHQKQAVAVTGEGPSFAGRGHPGSAYTAKRCQAPDPGTAGWCGVGGLGATPP